MRLTLCILASVLPRAYSPWVSESAALSESAELHCELHCLGSYCIVPESSRLSTRRMLQSSKALETIPALWLAKPQIER